MAPLEAGSGSLLVNLLALVRFKVSPLCEGLWVTRTPKPVGLDNPLGVQWGRPVQEPHFPQFSCIALWACLTCPSQRGLSQAVTPPPRPRNAATLVYTGLQIRPPPPVS